MAKDIDTIAAAAGLADADKILVAQGDAVGKRSTLTAVKTWIKAWIVKGDVGLGNVDNTSDATKNAAAVTLTNKTLTAPVVNSPTGIVKADVGLGNVDNTSDATKNAASVTLTNKTLTSPVINTPTGIVKGDVGLGSVANHADASAAEVLSGAADKVVESDILLSALAAVALTDGANIAVDLAAGVYFTLTLTGTPHQLDNPSNHKVGRTIYIKVTQDGTGTRILTYDTQYDFGQDSAPTLSTGAGKVDLLAFFVSTTSKLIYLGCRTDVG